ncbi:MAG: agmatine deiminase [Campylobacteraceae bacterium 4484_4]|nr:MAG: agmatine deiminase [Campylobacteraceae bacterium 4484_4]
MRRMPAEWEKQEAVLFAFPHSRSDWADDLQSAYSVFLRMISAVSYHQKCIVLCHDREEIKSMFCYHDKISFVEMDYNDTWIRDYGPISVYEDGERLLLDFKFNAWGDKFPYDKDNRVTKTLVEKWFFYPTKVEEIDFVLEGGSIETDGRGTLLTTSTCLLNPNRNPGMSRAQIEERLSSALGIHRVLWLNHGELIGDDTDAHIDTLARFIDPQTIVYVACDDPSDPHFQPLLEMKKELESFKTENGNPYRLIPLPLPTPIFKTNRRLPATYANFLITNDAVLLPIYRDPADKEMIMLFKSLFGDREIIPIDARRLIEEGGSIHCSTMQLSALREAD